LGICTGNSEKGTENAKAHLDVGRVNVPSWPLLEGRILVIREGNVYDTADFLGKALQTIPMPAQGVVAAVAGAQRHTGRAWCSLR
jgi:hypothetical protein